MATPPRLRLDLTLGIPNLGPSSRLLMLTPPAVFVSYASQDATPQRIANRRRNAWGRCPIIGVPDPIYRCFAPTKLRLLNSLLSRIAIDLDICLGKPAIRHKRYPVESMLEQLTGGDSIEDLLKEFPDLERPDLLACLGFATQSLKLKSQHLVLA